MARQRFKSGSGGLLSYFTRHKTAANLLLVVMIFGGLLALPKMRAQFFPDVIIDNVSVSVRWDGAGAEDVDAGIVQILEPALLGVEGVAESAATASEGRAQIRLEFSPGWDMARAAEDVQNAVDAVNSLPEDADDPQVRRGAWRDRVTDVIITGPVGVDQLGRFADELVTRLFAEGVTRTTIRGVAAPQTIVEVATIDLIRHDVTMSQIANMIASEAETDPAGDVSGANARVRTGIAKRRGDQIEAIVLRVNSDGSKLLIGDVAQVRVEGVDRGRAYFVDENSAMSVRVDRSDKGDAIRIQAKVQKVADDMELSLPAGVKVDLIRTRAEAISDRLDILVDNGLIGLGLVVGLLFLFLNARTAFWVAAGIPVAMFATIGLMYLFGLTINMVSLFALIITLGIVVDDAIVVGEHADFRARRLGESPVEAAENAARRMSLPVFSATLTTIIAFFALTAVEGRFGDLIADIPITVIAVLIASLVECFLILPNHMSHALVHTAKTHWYDLPSRFVNIVFDWFRVVIFRRLMRLVIWARYPVMAGAVVILVGQVVLFINGDVSWRFFNAPERSSVSGNFVMANGATREDSLEMMREMQRATEALGAKLEAEHGTNPLVFVLAEVGGSTGRGVAGADNKDRDLLGSIAIELIEADFRPYSSFQFVADLQDSVRQHPLAENVSFRGWRSGPGGDALDVQFIGADGQTLKAAAESLKTELAKFGEVSAVEDTLSYDKEELILELTPQGQTLGFTIDGLGRVLRHRLNGIEAASFPDGPRTASIRVELPDGELTADFLDRMQMRTETGDYVALSDLVHVTTQSGFSTVQRENGLRVISVTGDISEDDPTRANEIMETLQDVILPEIQSRNGVTYRLSGLAEQEGDFLNDALLGFLTCLIGIYLVLAWVFSSWTRPMVVMAIIPFGLVGTIYGHYVWDVPLSMFTVVGMIGMTGIIINDSIVLVTTVDEYAADRGLVPAIIDAASDRLRPVLLTTLTTVLGLAPLLYEQSQQAQFLKPTVITLCYGLGFGMILVLLVVPALLAMQLDVRRQVTSLSRAIRLPRGAGWVSTLAVCAVIATTALFTATLGWVIYEGKILPDLIEILPVELPDMSPLMLAFGLFIAGTAGIAISIYALGILFYGIARTFMRRSPLRTS